MWTGLGRFFRAGLWAASRHSGTAGCAAHEVAGLPADVRASIEEDGVVFLHIGDGKMFRTNATGRRIWQLLLEQRPVNAIAEQLSAEYGVPSGKIERDARLFVADLRHAGLLAMCNQE
jgi:hypothetical protein